MIPSVQHNVMLLTHCPERCGETVGYAWEARARRGISFEHDEWLSLSHGSGYLTRVLFSIINRMPRGVFLTSGSLVIIAAENIHDFRM